ncbi:MAG: Gfo/Idh/MocA family oxidoreductase [Thermoguttaceae bacterium]
MAHANRRRFLKTSATVAGAAMLATPAVASSVRSPNDRIRIGLVGMGNRMRFHINSFLQMAKNDNVEIAAICDCDQARLATARKSYPALAEKQVTVYDDFHKLLDDKSIDVVDFSTQDHWHALQTILACQAGKDVYVEKPASHNIWEGRKMIEAARKYNRMVQVGMQNRSSPNVMEGIRKLHEGVIGKLYMARGVAYKMRGHLGNHRARPVPPGLNWDAWVGPAKMVEFSNFNHRRWYWNSNFASGDIANQTCHDVDLIRWGLDLDTHPSVMMSLGGRYVPAENDAADTPNTQSLICQWEGRNLQVSFEVRHWYTNSEADMRDKYPFVEPNAVVGVMFFGSEGYMIIPDYTSYYVFLGPNHELGPHATAGQTDDLNKSLANLPHFQNWIAACRSRRREDLHADIEQGHLSTSMCHLAKISNHLKRSVRIDPKTECFTGDDEANALLKREYRAPYVVPEQV